jgi:hypothetical protein
VSSAFGMGCSNDSRMMPMGKALIDCSFSFDR